MILHFRLIPCTDPATLNLSLEQFFRDVINVFQFELMGNEPIKFQIVCHCHVDKSWYIHVRRDHPVESSEYGFLVEWQKHEREVGRLVVRRKASKDNFSTHSD